MASLLERVQNVFDDHQDRERAKVRRKAISRLCSKPAMPCSVLPLPLKTSGRENWRSPDPTLMAPFMPSKRRESRD
jgi:hypothetical protein